MSKRVPKCGVFAFKRAKVRPRNKKRFKRPIWRGVAPLDARSKVVIDEKYHCFCRLRRYNVSFACQVVIPLRDGGLPPKKCIKEVSGARG